MEKLLFEHSYNLNKFKILLINMKINKISLKNFRLLDDVNINLEDDITLIIGKNNTGKTSFFEAIKILATGEEQVSFEDFSQSTYAVFGQVYEMFLTIQREDIVEEEKDEIETSILALIPKIELSIEIEYNKDIDKLVELSEFITDLDEKRNDASILISYEPKNTLGLLKSYFNKSAEPPLINYLKENLDSFYNLTCYAIDKNSGYKRKIEGSFKNKIKKIVSFEDIKALRLLDDKKGDRNNTLALGFSKYYNERDKTNGNVVALEDSLKIVSANLKMKYNNVLEKILFDLKNFGASTPITIPSITIESEFDSESVIKSNIKYYYEHDDINLPESYNGLGYSNLIYMILELASFIERFRNAKDEKVSEFLVVLIEEPEAHMHPQMQQVFISQINKVIQDAQKDNIYVQLVITSHSSHIISEAGIDLERGFNRIRYFNKINSKIIIKDFNYLKIKDDKKTFRFLKQYLTINKSDLFFADKVIMVEGVTERMLLPQMIEKVSPTLQNEYLAILEVGGAYVHIFKELLYFINIKTLIITDIDSIDAKTGEKCIVNNGLKDEITSNSTLSTWIPGKKLIKELIACKDDDKIENKIIRVAFQINEKGNIARSFEEAFIHSNKTLIMSATSAEVNGHKHFFDNKDQFTLFKSKKMNDIIYSTSFELAPEDSKVKTNFAFDIMSFQEDIYKWTVPAYIKEGLEWLAKND
jgi:putative ATP-dependent endonuclease of the OLD family